VAKANPEVLVQVRISPDLAGAAKVRAAQLGLPLSHWVRSLIQQELSADVYEAWAVNEGESEAWINEIKRGSTRAPYLLVAKTPFDGERLTAEVRGALSGGRPYQGPLNWAGLQRYDTFQDENWKRQWLFTRPGTWWRAEPRPEMAGRPALVELRKTEGPRAGAPTG
jgi:hypothetical protein